MTLEAIGQKLKSAREAQGLSLRQIYERTKIPINHLQSIDGGQSDDLPEPVYVAGFIKLYAECIGLDGQVLASEYRRLDNGNGNGIGKSKTGAGQSVYITPEYLKHARIDDRAPGYKLWPFCALMMIALMGLLSWYFNQRNNSNQQDPTVLSLKDSVSRLPPPNSVALTSPGASGGTATTTTNPPASDDKVVLSATRHVWVDIKRLGSGESIYTGYLEPGERRDFQDAQGLRVSAENGGDLSVEFKGKIEAFGAPGQKSERVFAQLGTAVSASTEGKKPLSPSGATGVQAGLATSTKPKKRKATDSSTPRSSSQHWRSNDNGARSIPGEDGGSNSVDVPYRYSEGRLDAN